MQTLKRPCGWSVITLMALLAPPLLAEPPLVALPLLAEPPLLSRIEMIPHGLQAFSANTNYMSIPGFWRWQDCQATGLWLGGVAYLSDEFMDYQDKNPDAVSGLDVKTVRPDTVYFALSLNGGHAERVSYTLAVVHPPGVIGDAARLDWQYKFLVGAAFHYKLTKTVTVDGALDKATNVVDEGNPNRAHDCAFHLEAGPNGGLVIVDEFSKKGDRSALPFDGRHFILTGLTYQPPYPPVG